jgi:hypothetical protein
MNIFVLDTDTRKAAAYHCDKHVVKMCLEYAQLLSTTANNVLAEQVGYKSTHVNHPCSVWTRKSAANVRWLAALLVNLGDEYTKRYDKVHKSVDVGVNAAWRAVKHIPDIGLTPFAQAMPDEYKDKNPVTAYRRYYIMGKNGFATWKNGEPDWWNV